MQKKNIFAIIGSAGNGSANQKLVDIFTRLTADYFQVTQSADLKTLPHFDPGLSDRNPPEQIINLRQQIDEADGVLICTPEYIFSIPSGLKNVIEWCVITTIFTDKPLGIVTAAAGGEKAHEELHLIMKTLMAKFTDETTLLIQGIKGKINEAGEITDQQTTERFAKFVDAFKNLVQPSA